MTEFYFTPEEINALLRSFPNGVVVFDTETTGLSPLQDSIIEISAFKVTREGYALFDELINPKVPIPEISRRIHGISDEMVKDADGAAQVLKRFMEFVGEMPLVAHNARFDAAHLIFALYQHGIKIPSIPIYCSCQLSRAVFKGAKSHALQKISEEFGFSTKRSHRALDDSYLALKLLMRALLTNLAQCGFHLEKCRLYLLSDLNEEGAFTLPPHLEALLLAVREQRPLIIDYRGGTSKGERPIRPIGILPEKGGTTLYGHCLKSDLYKNFSLKKIAMARDATDDEIEPYKSIIPPQFFLIE